jgi:hypothetical protein
VSDRTAANQRVAADLFQPDRMAPVGIHDIEPPPQQREQNEVDGWCKRIWGGVPSPLHVGLVDYLIHGDQSRQSIIRTAGCDVTVTDQAGPTRLS